MDQSRLNQIMQMLEKNPDDSFLNYAAALEFKKNGKIDSAIDLLEKLIASDENYLAAYYQLGKNYEAVSETERAKNIFLKGKDIAVKKNDLKTLNEIEEALILLNDEHK